MLEWFGRDGGSVGTAFTLAPTGIDFNVLQCVEQSVPLRHPPSFPFDDDDDNDDENRKDNHDSKEEHVTQQNDLNENETDPHNPIETANEMETCCTNDTLHETSPKTPYDDLAPKPDLLDYTHPICDAQQVSDNFEQQ